jgi:hypothetical protein
MTAPNPFALPYMTAEQAHALLRLLFELETAIWNAYDAELTALAIRELHQPDYPDDHHFDDPSLHELP